MALATLSIDIVAELAKLREDMGKAGRIGEQWRNEMQGHLDSVRQSAANFAIGVAAGMAGAFTVGAVREWIAAHTEAADELHRLSQQTGVSVEALSAWGNVAKRNGQDVNDLAETIQELSLKLTETDKDTEGAGLALKQLGLDYKALSKMGAEEAFKSLATALAGVEDGGKKTALTMAILGDEGQKYITTLNAIGSAAELEATVTDEQAAAAARYKDSLAGLRAVGDEWSQSIVAGITPALDEATRALTAALTGTDGLATESRKLARDGSLADWARSVVTSLTYLLDAGELVTRSLKSVGLVVGGMMANVGAGISSASDAASRAMAGDLAGAVEAVKGYGAQVKSIDANLSADLSSTWGETLGSQIRSRMDQMRAAGVLAEQAVKPPKPPKKSDDNFTLVKQGGDGGAAKKQQDEARKALEKYNELITTIRTKTAADEAEAQGLAPLTRSQQYALEVMTQLRDGRLKLTDEQKRTVTQYLEEAAAAEQAAEAVKRQAAWLDESRNANADALDQAQQRTAALREQAGAERMQVAEFGLSARALQTLREVRQLDTAAALESRAAAVEGLDSHAELSRQWREQAAAIRDIVAAQRDRSAAEQASRENPVAGIQRALDDYRDKLRATGDDFQASFSTVASGIEDALASAFSGSADGAKRLFETIKAEALKLLVIKPIMQQLVGAGGGNPWGALAGAVGGLFGGGSVGNAGAGDYSSAGLAAAFGGGRAAGGPVAPGTLYEVNERGPELLTVGQRTMLMLGAEGGRVTPLSQSPAGGGAGGRGPVSVTYSPVINIDSRSDRAAILADVGRMQEQGHASLIQSLRDRGVMA